MNALEAAFSFGFTVGYNQDMATANVTPVATPVAILAPTVTVQAAEANEPVLWRFSVDDYYRMGAAGVFKPGDRVELIRGAIVQMNPIGNRHARCVNRLGALLYRTYGEVAEINLCNPVRLDDTSEPQPDFALLRFSLPQRESHPGPADVLVAIEVSDSSIRYDRNVKAPLYAEAGIPEYWVVDLEAETVEIRRQPSKSGYRELQTLARGDQLRCLAFPDAVLEVADILG